jgi:hypothetical protein
MCKVFGIVYNEVKESLRKRRFKAFFVDTGQNRGLGKKFLTALHMYTNCRLYPCPEKKFMCDKYFVDVELELVTVNLVIDENFQNRKMIKTILNKRTMNNTLENPWEHRYESDINVLEKLTKVRHKWKHMREKRKIIFGGKYISVGVYHLIRDKMKSILLDLRMKKHSRYKGILKLRTEMIEKQKIAAQSKKPVNKKLVEIEPYDRFIAYTTYEKVPKYAIGDQIQEIKKLYNNEKDYMSDYKKFYKEAVKQNILGDHGMCSKSSAETRRYVDNFTKAIDIMKRVSKTLKEGKEKVAPEIIEKDKSERKNEMKTLDTPDSLIDYKNTPRKTIVMTPASIGSITIREISDDINSKVKQIVNIRNTFKMQREKINRDKNRMLRESNKHVLREMTKTLNEKEKWLTESAMGPLVNEMLKDRFRSDTLPSEEKSTKKRGLMSDFKLNWTNHKLVKPQVVRRFGNPRNSMKMGSQQRCVSEFGDLDSNIASILLLHILQMKSCYEDIDIYPMTPLDIVSQKCFNYLCNHLGETLKLR